MIVLELCAGDSDVRFLDHLVFTESSAWKIAQFLNAMGEELIDQDIDPDDYIGRTARAIVGAREYQGRIQNCIESWLPPESTSAAASSPSAAQPDAGEAPNAQPSTESTARVADSATESKVTAFGTEGKD
jgi:hypothetical protein